MFKATVFINDTHELANPPFLESVKKARQSGSGVFYKRIISMCLIDYIPFCEPIESYMNVPKDGMKNDMSLSVKT